MRKLAVIFCLSLCAMVVYARPIQEDMKKASEKARVSYAFGMVIGSDISSAGMEIDYAAFTDGVRAALEKSGEQMSETEAMEIVQASLQRAMDQKAGESREKEARYLAENAMRPEVQTTPSGLQYEALVEGDGERPGSNSIVLVNYEGSLIDGTVFDSSLEEGGVEIPLDRVIPGWTEGITLMTVGSKYRLYIPSQLAYGGRGAGQVIPPYSTLIFTVELLGIEEPDFDDDDDDDADDEDADPDWDDN